MYTVRDEMYEMPLLYLPFYTSSFVYVWNIDKVYQRLCRLLHLPTNPYFKISECTVTKQVKTFGTSISCALCFLSHYIFLSSGGRFSVAQCQRYTFCHAEFIQLSFLVMLKGLALWIAVSVYSHWNTVILVELHGNAETLMPSRGTI